MWKYFIFVIFSGLMGNVQLNPAAEAFLWNDVVPDILNNTPTRWLNVCFPSGAEAQLGNTLSLEDVVQEPKLNWEVIAGDCYTVLFVDPDVPSRANPDYRSFLHWLVVNVPGTNVTAGRTIASFVNSQPPAGSGAHRYVFIIYVQPACGMFNGYPEYVDEKQRRSFQVECFANQYDLGKPLAGNLYYAENCTKSD